MLRIRQGLTPLAAAGLAIIMAGATVTTLAIGGGASALMPLALGLLAVLWPMVAAMAAAVDRLRPMAPRSAELRAAN